MREHQHHASRRRDEGLARIRKISLWITGGAAFASLGLGTAFAQELPGHTSAGTRPDDRSTVRSTSGQPGSGTARGHRHQNALGPPTQAPQQPASIPAPPPVVSSGGS
jgi:hypothetical protein